MRRPESQMTIVIHKEPTGYCPHQKMDGREGRQGDMQSQGENG